MVDNLEMPVVTIPQGGQYFSSAFLYEYTKAVKLIDSSISDRKIYVQCMLITGRASMHEDHIKGIYKKLLDTLQKVTTAGILPKGCQRYAEQQMREIKKVMV